MTIAATSPKSRRVNASAKAFSHDQDPEAANNASRDGNRGLVRLKYRFDPVPRPPYVAGQFDGCKQGSVLPSVLCRASPINHPHVAKF